MDEFNVEDLIGNEINYTWKSRGIKRPAIIAGIVEGVGWTLVAAEDKTEELCCWNGPKSPKRDKSTDVEAFIKAWPTVVEMLKKGYYNSDKIFSAAGFEGSCGGMTCAFT